jgi:hypothetical protein
MITNVSLAQLLVDLKRIGGPGSEILTTDVIVLSGGYVAAPSVGSTITQPAPVKLYDEYEYYIREIRVSTDAVPDATGGSTRLFTSDLQHLVFNLSADGRTRNLFRAPIPFAMFVSPVGQSVPMRLDQWIALSGSETLRAEVATAGVFNAHSIEAELHFTIVCVASVIRRNALLSPASPRR